MPLRTVAPLGAPCWIDLMSTDQDGARAFYSELFGWTSQSGGEEYGGYVTFSLDGVPVAGCMTNSPESGMPDFWTVYLASADATATTESAAAHGGQVFMPAMQVLELGSMSMLGDPGGAGIGVWQPALHPGFGVLDEDGAPSWFELHTREYESSVQFYEDVFEWDTHVASDVPGFRYTTLGKGDGQLAGIMDASAFRPEGTPAEWSIYFGTADTDASLARVEQLGGSVIEPAEDTPYGRLARVADPTGAQFKLRSIG